MTISTTTRTNGPYETNGVTTNFAYTFEIAADSELEVYLDDVLQTLDSDYTVTGAGDEGGGNVVISPALDSGSFISIKGVVDYAQETDFGNQGGWHPEVHESAFDKLTKMAIDLNEKLGRSIQFPLSDPVSFEYVLPNAGSRANKLLGFGATGALGVYSGADGSSAAATAAGSSESRLLADRFADIIRPEDFGAAGDGVADDTIALQSMVSAVNSADAGNVLFKGYYKSAAVLAFTAESLSLNFEVRGKSGLLFPDSDGITVTQTGKYSSFSATNMLLVTGAEKTRTGFAYVNSAVATGDMAPKVLDHPICIGEDRLNEAGAPYVEGWLTALYFDNADRTEINNPYIQGAEQDRLDDFPVASTGIYLTDSTAFNINNPQIFICETGVKVRGQSEGTEVLQGAIVANKKGIDFQTDTAPANDFNIIGVHIASMEYNINLGSGGSVEPSMKNVEGCLLFTRSEDTVSTDFKHIITNGQCQISDNFLFTAGGHVAVKLPSSITSDGVTATVTEVGHGRADSSSVTIDGADQEEYNGTYTITYVDVDTYTYTHAAGTPASPATGSITEVGSYKDHVGVHVEAAALTTGSTITSNVFYRIPTALQVDAGAQNTVFAGNLTTDDGYCVKQPVLSNGAGSSTIIGDTYGNRSTKKGDPVNVLQYGADPSGTRDSRDAIQNAINAAVAAGVAVDFPAGTYLQTSVINVALTGDQTLHMYARGEVIWRMNTNVGISLTIEGNSWLNEHPDGRGYFYIEGFDFTTVNEGTGSAFLITGSSTEGRPTPKSMFNRCFFRGWNTQAQYWALAVDVTDQSNCEFRDCMFWAAFTGYVGQSIKFKSSGPTTDATGFMLAGCKFFYGSVAVQVEDYCEGLYAVNCSWVRCNNAIKYDAATGPESGLNVSNCHINTNQAGIIMNNVFDFDITGNLIFTPESYAGIQIDETGGFTGGGWGAITGNTFRITGWDVVPGDNYGIRVIDSVDNAGRGLLISGNGFHEYDIAVWLSAESNHVEVKSNSFFNCVSRVTDQSTSGNNVYEGPTYARSLVYTLTGGSPTEQIVVTVPDNMFLAENVAAFCISTDKAVPIVGSLQYLTAPWLPNFTFDLHTLDGSNIPAGATRFSVMISGETGVPLP